MSILAQLDNDFKAALRVQDAERLSVLRLVRSAIKNLEIAKQGAAADEDVIAILQREIKQHRETVAALERAGRGEDIIRQKAEIDLLQSYLPPALSSDELKDLIEKEIERTGAQGMADAGRIMGKVMPQVKGRATGDVVGQMVRELLGNK